MRYQVKDLEGALLDLAVAKAEGATIEHANIGEGWMVAFPGAKGVRIVGVPRVKAPLRYSPSTDGADGVLIIERERIALRPFYLSYEDSGWEASINAEGIPAYELVLIEGRTALIAAMRAYVSKFGDEIELP